MIALLLIATAGAHARYDEAGAPRAAEMVAQAVRFATVAGRRGARRAEGMAAAHRLRSRPGCPRRRDDDRDRAAGTGRSAGARAGGARRRAAGRREGVDDPALRRPSVRDGRVWGRGAADDKGPMVQALLAMAALKEAGPARTHTVRLLVGTDEESGSTDVKQYPRGARSARPEPGARFGIPGGGGRKGLGRAHRQRRSGGARCQKAVDGRFLSTRGSRRASSRIARASCSGGGRARRTGRKLIARLVAKTPPAGTRVEISRRAARSWRCSRTDAPRTAGVNLQGGRNALVALARGVEGELPAGGADDLLAFARLAAGQDLHGAALGAAAGPLGRLRRQRGDPRRARIARAGGRTGKLTLVVNLRRPPPAQRVRRRATGCSRWSPTSLPRRGGGAAPRRLLPGRAARLRSAGEDRPAADGRVPPGDRRRRPARHLRRRHLREAPAEIDRLRMWFPGKPYPGHDSDEQVPVADLHRGNARPDRGAARSCLFAAAGPIRSRLDACYNGRGDATFSAPPDLPHRGVRHPRPHDHAPRAAVLRGAVRRQPRGGRPARLQLRALPARRRARAGLALGSRSAASRCSSSRR